ncbi:MAG: GNAT family N-acetyltransferase [Hyphomicrobiaceae bacterium]
MPVEIRIARREDLAAVSALLGQTWHATYDGIYGPDRVAEITRRWHSVESLAKGIDRSGARFLVAVEDGRIVGTLSLGAGDAGRLKLDRLYVLPDVQRRGIGGRLLDAGLAAVPTAEAIDLEVEPANAQAIRFYERQGFVVTGETSDCSGSGDRIPALIMSRTLKAQSPQR